MRVCKYNALQETCLGVVTRKHSFQTLQVKPSRPCNLGNTANTFKRFKIYFFFHLIPYADISAN